MKKRVYELLIGDMVDLYGDDYADPTCDPAKGYEFEFQEVGAVTREDDNCILVDFEGADAIGFPPDYLVSVPDPAPPPAG